MSILICNSSFIRLGYKLEQRVRRKAKNKQNIEDRDSRCIVPGVFFAIFKNL